MITPRLQQYIDQQYLKDVSPQDIRAALIEAGWETKDVNQAIPVKERNPLVRVISEFLIGAFALLPFALLPLIMGGGIYAGFVRTCLISLLIGGLIDVAYCEFFRRFVTPSLHPKRALLLFLIAGPLLLFAAGTLLKYPLFNVCFIAVAVEIIIVTFVGGSLIWDVLASAVGVGLLYSLLYLWLNVPVPLSIGSVLSHSGITIANHPLEQTLTIFLFGTLWGPLSAALRLAPERLQPFQAKHYCVKQGVLVVFSVAIIGAAAIGYTQFSRTPIAVAASPIEGALVENLNSSITVTFNKPIDRESVAVNLTPSVQGDLSFGSPTTQRTFVRQLSFTPSQHLQPATNYTVHITKLSSILGRNNASYTLQFHTPKLSSVASTVPQKNQHGTDICAPITIILDQAVTPLTQFSFELLPSTSIVTHLSTDKKSYTITPSTCLNQNTSYTVNTKRLLTVYTATGSLTHSDDLPVIVNSFAFTTKTSPGISSFSPQGNNVHRDVNQLSLMFSDEMVKADTSSLLSITPTLSGSWQWSDTRSLVFSPSTPLQLDTQYVITLKKGLQDTQNGFLPEDTHFSFTTLGHVRINAISPQPTSNSVSISSTIRVSFDQPVDHSSAEQHFSLTPTVAGSFSWQGDTMQFSTTLSKDSSYQIAESPGVPSLVGLPLQTGSFSSFQTEESVILLPISQYYQQYPLSCEVASLKMALAYRGVSISESTLLGVLGTDSTPRQVGIWGDPYQAFVGDVNGHQNTTGYGVYASPLSSLANQYRSTQAVSGMTTQQIANNLSQANPVIFWGTAGNAKADHWTTPAGRPIDGWVGEHVRLIVGFTGTVNRPTSFTINDPIFGRLHWSSSQLQSNMSAFNGMGVVIY